MELEQLIKKLEVGKTSEKTASEKPSTEANLKNALTDSLGAVAPAIEKTASEDSDAVETLKKIASDLAGLDKQAEEAHVTSLANVFADTVMNKFAGYTAALPPTVDATPAQTPELVDALKTAATQGYADTVQALQGSSIEEWEKAAAAGNPQAIAQMEKFAAEQFDAGQDQALADVQGQAAQEFIKGAQEVGVLLQHLEQRQ